MWRILMKWKKESHKENCPSITKTSKAQNQNNRKNTPPWNIFKTNRPSPPSMRPTIKLSSLQPAAPESLPKTNATPATSSPSFQVSSSSTSLLRHHLSLKTTWISMLCRPPPPLPAEYVDEPPMPPSENQMLLPSSDIINEDEEPVQQQEAEQLKQEGEKERKHLEE